MDRVIGGMKEVIYKKEKKNRKKYRTLWYTTIDRERKRDVAPLTTKNIEATHFRNCKVCFYKAGSAV